MMTLEEIKRDCLGTGFNPDTFKCKACEDHFECKKLHTRWLEKQKRNFIFTYAITLCDPKEAPKRKCKQYPKEKKITQKIVTSVAHVIKKQPTKEELLAQIKILEEML